jgi:predicted NUDIX family phosphoesterase
MMERVLVVPRGELFAAGHLQGFCDDQATVNRFLDAVAAFGRFVPRRPAEEDEGLKQIVPYGIVLYGESLFLFRRGGRGAEPGLRGRWSIGLGGHVNPEDGREIGPALLTRSLLRELAEEVILDTPRPGLWGVLNDDQDTVGRRHFGFVYRVHVSSPQAHSREPGKIQGRFSAQREIRSRCQDMETWSQLLVESLLGMVAGCDNL